MAGYFYPDTDHDNPKVTNAFCAQLSALAQRGVKVVFLEFVGSKIPPDAEAFKEYFAECSGGRRLMAASYHALVRRAEELGMKVLGLHHSKYAEMRRGSMVANMSFRNLGPFDGAVATILRKFENGAPFVIFLGAGHWPLLSHYVKSLQLVVPCNEALTKLSDVPGSEETILKAQEVAEEITTKKYGALVLDAGCEGKETLDNVVRYCSGAEDVARLLVLATAALKSSPDILQINYLLTKWRLTEFKKPAPDLGPLPQINAPLELGTRKLVLRIRGG